VRHLGETIHDHEDRIEAVGLGKVWDVVIADEFPRGFWDGKGLEFSM
jgi:hypothetical protein